MGHVGFSARMSERSKVNLGDHSEPRLRTQRPDRDQRMSSGTLCVSSGREQMRIWIVASDGNFPQTNINMKDFSNTVSRMTRALSNYRALIREVNFMVISPDLSLSTTQPVVVAERSGPLVLDAEKSLSNLGELSSGGKCAWSSTVPFIPTFRSPLPHRVGRILLESAQD
jgi:hypothetical protein